MIQINTQSTLLPVQIGELTFHFDVSDAGLKELQKKHATAMKKISKLNENDENAVNKTLTEVFDLLLGEGAYKKIYEQTPSTVICIDTLVKLAQAISAKMNEISPITQQAKAQSYVARKKKNRKK